MEKRPEDLSGMNAAEAREYILNFIAALKLTEKKLRELDGELIKWNSRIDLARSKEAAELATEAEKEAEKIKAQQAELIGEIGELKAQIGEMRKQLPGLAARERSIDPDLLEQELLMAAGYLPGDDEKAATDRSFRELEKQGAADAALEELKLRLGKK
jgi:phage shock protein A